MQKQVNCNPKILLSNSEIFLRVQRTLLSNKTGSESVVRAKPKGQWWLGKQSSVHSGYVFGTQISLENVFSLKSDKSAKQYKLGQVLSWRLIYFWKNKPSEFRFYGQYTCEALDFSLQGRVGFWNSSTRSQWICSKFKDDHWEQERLRNLDIELCCFASTQHLEPILTLAVDQHLQACRSQNPVVQDCETLKETKDKLNSQNTQVKKHLLEMQEKVKHTPSLALQAESTRPNTVRSTALTVLRRHSAGNNVVIQVLPPRTAHLHGTLPFLHNTLRTSERFSYTPLGS